MINADSASSNYQKQEWREFDYNICICFAKLKPEKQRGIIKAMAAHCNQVNFEERKGHFSKSTCAASETTTCGVCTRGALHTSAGTGELQGSEEGKCVATLGSNSLLQFGECCCCVQWDRSLHWTADGQHGICVTHGVHEATEHMPFTHSWNWAYFCLQSIVRWKETICELGHIAGQCITIIIKPDSTTLQMLMSSSFLKCGPTSSLKPELGADWNLTFCAPGVPGAVGNTPSHHTGSRNCLVPSWSSPFMGGLCQICLLCECESSPKRVRLRAEKQVWESLLWQLWKHWHWPQGVGGHLAEASPVGPQQRKGDVSLAAKPKSCGGGWAKAPGQQDFPSLCLI